MIILITDLKLKALRIAALLREGDNFDKELLSLVQEKYKHVNPLLFFQDHIQKQNWNEEKLKQNIRKIFETGHLPVVDQSTKEENIQQANGSLVIVEQRLFPIQTEHGFTLGVALRKIAATQPPGE